MLNRSDHNLGERKAPALGASGPVRLVVAIVLASHAGLLLHSASRNSITYDEVAHLPAGLSYWRHGQFWCYHHNPPLVRLIASAPALAAGVALDDRHYRPAPGSRWPDSVFAQDFMRLHRDRYMEVFFPCRAAVAGLSVLG